MEFSNLLKPEAIRIFSSVSSKKRLLHDLAGIAESCYHTDYSNTVEALIERESLGPTGVGGGVALPHARLENLDHVVGAFILLESPVEFEAIDRQPVDIVFRLQRRGRDAACWSRRATGLACSRDPHVI